MHLYAISAMLAFYVVVLDPPISVDQETLHGLIGELVLM